MKGMRLHTPLQLSDASTNLPSLPHAEARANHRHWHPMEHCSYRLAQAACVLLHSCLDAATEFVISLHLKRQVSEHLKGGHSCSLVLRAHVLLEHSQGNPMSTQVAADQLDVHPELTEDNGLGQALALLLGRLQHSMQSFALTLACVTERTV